MQKGCNDPLYDRKQGCIAMEHVVSRGHRKNANSIRRHEFAGMIMHNRPARKSTNLTSQELVPNALDSFL